jgi:tripartite-type tricarboxylate transporter receptor subunit TctC
MSYAITSSRALRLAAALFTSLAVLAEGASAQSLSQKPVTLVVPFGAGSGADAVARMIVDPLAKQLGTSVAIDNKPGALGQIGVAQVRRSAPDGHTLLLGEPGVLVFYPLAKKPAPFDPVKDFAHISLIGESGLTWLVPAQRGYKSVKDFVARQQGKDKTMLLSVALASDVATALFADLGGFKYEPIAIRSAGDVVPLIARGDAEGVFVSNSFAAAQIAGGRLTGLMQTGESRSKMLPDVPTAAEAGFPRVNAPTWWSVAAPAGTPDAIVEQLNKAITHGSEI